MNADPVLSKIEYKSIASPVGIFVYSYSILSVTLVKMKLLQSIYDTSSDYKDFFLNQYNSICYRIDSWLPALKCFFKTNLLSISSTFQRSLSHDIHRACRGIEIVGWMMYRTRLLSTYTALLYHHISCLRIIQPSSRATFSKTKIKIEAAIG